ncbi:MAG TPA: type II secretion system minor pseudopilin GspJ [Rhodocyclaceae bacterium]|nr:type II secretion system minor pseudopilin GspJ [Rhodocyclaceae bacterium]
MKSSSKCSCLRGVTLIEVLIAIVIFSILGIMSYRAISQATNSRERLAGEFSDWQGLSRALGRVETDFQQMGARYGGASVSIPNDAAGNALPAALALIPNSTSLVFTQLPDGGSRLIFWRMDADQGARLTGFEFANGSLDLLRWMTADVTQAPRREKLLTDVTSIRWAFAGADKPQWLDSWPPNPSRAGELPVGISVELVLAKFGKINRVFAIN